MTVGSHVLFSLSPAVCGDRRIVAGMARGKCEALPTLG